MSDASGFEERIRRRGEWSASRLAVLFEDGLTQASRGLPAAAPRPELDALVAKLASPLRQVGGSRASAAAEVAYVLCAMAVLSNRVPKLDSRLPGDRAASEALSKLLLRRNIPATLGALQSNTYRGGYRARQARDTSLADFVEWAERQDRTVEDFHALFERLGAEFASHASAAPALPLLFSGHFTFARTRILIERLLAHNSGGAYEQYLVAGLLTQEYQANGLRWSVGTKRVGASDAVSNSVGDVQVRHRQRLQHAIEVSASGWRGKVSQAITSTRESGLAQATVVADAADLSGEALEVATGADRGVDVAVVDLGSYLDFVSARLRPDQRAEAVRLVYGYLVRWDRTRADLAQYLVDQLVDLGLAGDGDVVEAAEPDQSIRVVAERLRSLAEGPPTEEVKVSRSDLRLLLTWADDVS